MRNWLTWAKLAVTQSNFGRLCRHLYRDAWRFDIFSHASAMTYITLLSLVPSLAAILYVVTLFAPVWGEYSVFMDQFKAYLLSNLAHGSGEQVVASLDRLIFNIDINRIGLTGFAGIIVTLAILLRNIELAFNEIFEVKGERNFFSRFVHFWTFITLGTFLAGLGLGIASGFELQNLNPFSTERLGPGTVNWLAPKVAHFLFFFFLYKITPNRFVSARNAASGAFVASLLFSIASASYGAIITGYTSYQAIYGALASIPVFLIWVYVVWLIILLGAMVSSRFAKGIHQNYSASSQQLISAEACQENFFDAQLQSIDLLLVLVLVYRSHQSQDAKGLSRAQIKESVACDGPRIDAVLQFAESQNLLLHQSLTEDESQDRFYPCRAAEALKVQDVQDMFNHGSMHHFDLRLSPNDELRLGAFVREWFKGYQNHPWSQLNMSQLNELLRVSAQS